MLLSGKTPQRKEYQYPHNLTLTKPHDELIERFRLTYPEDETPDTSTTLSVNESAFKINSLENVCNIQYFSIFSFNNFTYF